jgi:hypothetical protein
MAALAVVLLVAAPAAAEVCYTAGEMEPAVRAGIERTAQDIFERASNNEAAALQQMAVGSLADDFSGIAAAVQEHASQLAGGSLQSARSFLLDNDNPPAAPRADFFCGVFGKSGHTQHSVGFSIPGLAPGRYAVVMQDVSTASGPFAFSVVLQQEAGAWKLAGLYLKPTRIAEQDGNVYWQRARHFKAAGQPHNAWFYYLTARELLAPVPFMSTAVLDKLYDEMQQARPDDLPYQQPVTLDAAGRTFQVTQVFAVPVAN